MTNKVGSIPTLPADINRRLDEYSSMNILLGDGSLFLMPPGMQDTHYHRIPKGNRQMGERISLTFRKWVQ